MDPEITSPTGQGNTAHKNSCNKRGSYSKVGWNNNNDLNEKM